MAVTETQVRAALRNALQDFTPRELGGFLTEEQQKFAAEQEAAKPVPQIVNLSDADWLKLKAFLLDGSGSRDFQSLFTKLRNAVKTNDQPTFWFTLLLLVKALRVHFIQDEL